MAIELRRISITELDTDAIVNAANEHLLAGGGVCGAIFDAAGRKQMQNACDLYEHCNPGEAVITPGFNLKAKYVIHAVGPIWEGGSYGEADVLRSAYLRSLELAYLNNCRSIAFPLISAGIYGYPVNLAWNVALSACQDYLDAHNNYPFTIVFAVIDDGIYKKGLQALLNIEAKSPSTHN